LSLLKIRQGGTSLKWRKTHITNDTIYVNKLDESNPSPLHGPHSPQGLIPLKGPITRSIMRKIQEGLHQDDNNSQGLQIFFSGVKRTSKHDGFHLKELG